MVKALSDLFDQGLSVVVQLEPPMGTGLDDFLRVAEELKDKASAFLVGDSPSADVRLASIAGAMALSQAGHETIYAITCRDRNRVALMSDLLGAHALGLRNVLALSGDHPAVGGHPGAAPVFDMDSVQFIDMIRGLNEGRKQNNQPIEPATEFYIGAVVNPEVRYTGPQFMKFRLKAEAGARFFFSQAIFNPDAFLALMEEAGGIGRDIKILAGLRLIGESEVPAIAAGRRPGLNLDPDVLSGIEADPASALDVTLDLAARTAAALKGKADGFVILAPGLLNELPGILAGLDLV